MRTLNLALDNLSPETVLNLIRLNLMEATRDNAHKPDRVRLSPSGVAALREHFKPMMSVSTDPGAKPSVLGLQIIVGDKE